MRTRDRLHRLIDDLPEDELAAVEEVLTRRRQADDPFLRALANAPAESEPLSPEDEADIDEGWEAIRRGELVSNDELRRKLGL